MASVASDPCEKLRWVDEEVDEAIVVPKSNEDRSPSAVDATLMMPRSCTQSAGQGGVRNTNHTHSRMTCLRQRQTNQDEPREHTPTLPLRPRAAPIGCPTAHTKPTWLMTE